ncbi:hypothetical protein B296_00012607 [Ensete ventricosum]|uniref:Small ribosomal subunit protein mS23 n=1 Tax=Ensete ventricosum TaxID=4639 RepID=A0A427A7V2_ENSVE|nr:hypothetical protein B296_00012607 [Ensete ventricosum]
MSYMRGDLQSRTRKLVKGLAKPTPVWLKPMEEYAPLSSHSLINQIDELCWIGLSDTTFLMLFLQVDCNNWFHRAPPVTFPRTDGKIRKIEMPEDVYVKRFFKKHPGSLYHDAVK